MTKWKLGLVTYHLSGSQAHTVSWWQILFSRPRKLFRHELWQKASVYQVLWRCFLWHLFFSHLTMACLLKWMLRNWVGGENTKHQNKQSQRVSGLSNFQSKQCIYYTYVLDPPSPCPIISKAQDPHLPVWSLLLGTEIRAYDFVNWSLSLSSFRSGPY